MITTEERQLGRAKNAVMFFLERNLIVPKIYVDASWGGHHVDILAIDRDGVGDVHVVLVFACAYDRSGNLDLIQYVSAVNKLIDRFANVPAQYKYIVAIRAEVPRLDSGVSISPWLSMDKLHELGVELFIDKSFSPDGMGRIGILSVQPAVDGEAQSKIEIKPERFRAKIAKLADEYVQHHEADWEIRA